MMAIHEITKTNNAYLLVLQDTIIIQFRMNVYLARRH